MFSCLLGNHQLHWVILKESVGLMSQVKDVIYHALGQGGLLRNYDEKIPCPYKMIYGLILAAKLSI